MAHELTTDEELTAVLRHARTVAVLGASDDPRRPANQVPAYLHASGYRLIPVNPGLAGRTLWGERVRATLADVGEPVDVVDVFRRPEALDRHLPELTAMRPLPRVVWLQLGIRNDPVAEALVAAGIDVVQDRCMLQEHGRLMPEGPSAGAPA